MNRPAAAVGVALASPLVGIAAFAACLIAAPIISPPKGPTA